MVRMTTLSVIAIVTAVSSGPVLAEQAMAKHPHPRVHHRHLSNQTSWRMRNDFPRFQQSAEEFRDRDPSRVGGEDPSRHPTAW
jgi:hypothetical protein